MKLPIKKLFLIPLVVGTSFYSCKATIPNSNNRQVGIYSNNNNRQTGSVSVNLLVTDREGENRNNNNSYLSEEEGYIETRRCIAESSDSKENLWIRQQILLVEQMKKADEKRNRNQEQKEEINTAGETKTKQLKKLKVNLPLDVENNFIDLFKSTITILTYSGVANENIDQQVAVLIREHTKKYNNLAIDTPISLFKLYSDSLNKWNGFLPKENDFYVHYVVSHGLENCVEQLIQAGADLNKQDNHRNTPLHLAIKGGKRSVALALIQAKADLDKPNNVGETPLHLATLNGSERSILMELIQAEADLDKPNNKGQTPLNLAVSCGHKGSALALIQAGADLDKQDNDGWTPLSLAVYYGCKDITLALIQFGADPDKPNNKGETPLDQAVFYGRKDIASILRVVGAKGSTLKKSNLGVVAGFIISYFR